MPKRPLPTRTAKQHSSTAGRSNESTAARDSQLAKIEPGMRRPGVGQRILLVIAACALLAWLAVLTYMAFR
jgi:ferric-dicitrate binding protein FerR (iron transport regulator)